MSITIKEQLIYLTDEFKRIFSDELWKSYPAVHIGGLDEPVNSRDSFVARLSALTSTFDAVNKKVFEKKLGYSTEGSRLALVGYLKLQLPGYDSNIDDSLVTLQMVSLLRSHFMHNANAGYKAAIEFFGIIEPIENYTHAWEGIRLRFQVFVNELVALIVKKNAPSLKQAQLQNDAIETAFLFKVQKHRRYLQDKPLAKLLLKEIAVKGRILDTELADMVLQPVALIRNILLPLTSSFLWVSYHSATATLLSVEQFREELKNIDDWLNR